MVKATDLKFGMQFPSDSSDTTSFLLLTDKVTKMCLNFYAVKICLVEIGTVAIAFWYVIRKWFSRC